MEHHRGGRPRHPDILTPAEWRVLEELRRGGTNAEIASRLGIGAETVKSHVSSMLAKLELRSREELAAWHPDGTRGRLRALFALPAVLGSFARPLMWVGAGVAVLAGVVAVVVALVVLEVALEGNGDPPAVNRLVVTGTVPPTPTPEREPAAAPVSPAAPPAADLEPSPAPSPTATLRPTPTPVPPQSAPRAAAPGRCAAPTEADCIVAVYVGAPDDYAQVAAVPSEMLLRPASDGRYYVGRGQQVTVVTAARLPAGYTRFDLQRTPLGTPPPVSASQLIQPVGTTYTFTVTNDEAAPTLITFDLTAARPHPIRPNHEPVLGDTVVTTVFSVPTFRYNLLDTTGAATAPGSYSFLQTAGDATSAINNFGGRPARGVELRIHPTDATGQSRAAVYDIVEIGDAFEYRMNGLDCVFRFRVTSVPTASSVPRSYGVDWVTVYGGRCGDAINDPAAAKDVDFAWLVPPGRVGEGGIRTLIAWEPAGKGTYRIAPGSRYLVDVPAGMRIVASPEYLRNSSYRTYIASGVTLIDEETGARLQISPGTGEVFARDASPRLDPIVDSIRLAD